MVASGKADAAVVSADEVVLARSKGLGVVAVFAPLQSSTRVVVVHRSSGMRRLGELEGLALAWDADAAVSQFLRQRLPLKEVRLLPAEPDLAAFLADTTRAQLGSCLVEELQAHEAGAHPLPLYVSETGFDPYGGVLVVSEKALKERPNWVRDLVWASQAGWARYLMHPQAAEARLHLANPGLTSTLLVQAHQELMRHCRTADLVEIPLGGMTARRWGLLVRQMEDMSVIRRGRVDPSKAWTSRYLPR
jgi:NitT/TauT family transport system substrate-binding protein